jgi:hypothetical protein
MTWRLYCAVKDLLERDGAPDALAKLRIAYENTTVATPEQVQAAIRRYARGSDDNIEVDDDTFTSESDEGTWIEAWVWLPKEG